MNAIASLSLLVTSGLFFGPGLLSAEAINTPPPILLAADEPPEQAGDVQERGLSGPLILPQSKVNPAISAAAAAMAEQKAELDPNAMLARIKLLEKVISCMLAFDRYGSGQSAPLTSFPQLYGSEVIWAFDKCH
jgi:hypothetical protein